jgi:hypothetical protein
LKIRRGCLPCLRLVAGVVAAAAARAQASHCSRVINCDPLAKMHPRECYSAGTMGEWQKISGILFSILHSIYRHPYFFHRVNQNLVSYFSCSILRLTNFIIDSNEEKKMLFYVFSLIEMLKSNTALKLNLIK